MPNSKIKRYGEIPVLYRENSRTRYGEIPVDFLLHLAHLSCMQFNTPAMPYSKDTFSHSHVSLALIFDLLRASREIFYFLSALSLQPEQNRKNLALLLTRMGVCLYDLYEKLVAGQSPKATCYRLEQFSYQLHFQIEPLLGNMRSRALTDKFNQTHCISLLYQELTSGLIDQRELILLQTAANHLTETALKLYTPHD